MEKFTTDIHIHLAGNDKESGCWFNPQRINSFGFRCMLKCLNINLAEDCLTDQIASRIKSNIDNSESLKNAVVLGYDWSRDDAGKPVPKNSDFYTPNEYALSFAAENENVFAGVSIHPYRKDALEELEKCRKQGAVLVKWLPVSQNFSPLDPRCDEFYRELKRQNLPLLCHTGSEGATININKEWNNPQVLEKALDMGLTVIAAHSGMRSAPHDRDYTDTWISMLNNYPNLFGDTAAIFGFRALKFPSILGSDKVMSRLIHGSDWPVPNSPWWFLGRLKLNDIIKLSKMKNPLERDIKIKLALGVEKEVFTRAENILNLENEDESSCSASQ
ncbi:MAG: amidohydrolase family protein [Planctomycetota bacterium]|jgi:predicted TIM-barrel fold metal-dependent hydrolase